MLLRAMEEWPVDLSRSFMIGDKDSDMEAAEAADIPVKRLFLGGDIEAAILKLPLPSSARARLVPLTLQLL